MHFSSSQHFDTHSKRTNNTLRGPGSDILQATKVSDNTGVRLCHSAHRQERGCFCASSVLPSSPTQSPVSFSKAIVRFIDPSSWFPFLPPSQIVSLARALNLTKMFKHMIPKASTRQLLRPVSQANSSFRASPSTFYLVDRLQQRRGYATETGMDAQ